MKRAHELLRAKGDSLAGSLVALLRETVFDNRYSLHPRRLAGLGAEIADSLIHGLETSDPTGARVLGGKLALEGLGEKNVLRVAARMRRFCASELGATPRTIDGLDDGVEQWASALLEGFMASREGQILKDQEQLRRALSTALQSQSAELLVKNHAIDTSINGILLADLDDKVTWVNSSFLRLWGYESAAEVQGMHIGEFWIGEEAQRIIGLLHSPNGWHGELAARRRDGTAFSVELSASLIVDQESRAIGVMTAFMDITERKRLQAQIMQVQKMDAIGQLAGGIAHDFNILLRAIGGYLQLLLLDAPRDTPMHQDLMQIKAAVDRGTGLTRQLRFFTRQATGKRAIVSLNDVARETYELFRRTFPPDITMELRLAESPCTIEADANQISQVLVNLCMNARDAMQEGTGRAGGGRLTIETTDSELSAKDARLYVNGRPGRYAVLRVVDTGLGMPPELLEKLFIPFVTTKGERSGTGLGLAVVYGIVASHGGFIDVQSEVGRGTIFAVFLPRSERTETGQGEAPAAAPARGHGTVLVVDDDPQVREVICRVLTACGYAVIPVASGRDALARYGQSGEIDLVILDMMMPGMSGRECLARLLEANPRARVLITTGYTSDGSAEELLAEGAMGIVEKPLEIAALAQKVRDALDDGAARPGA